MSSVLVAVAGGIGAGKSVVSRILRVMGYGVYDCDSHAKAIMDTDKAIHARLVETIHPQCVVDGIIDRSLISKIVFSDSAALASLNSIVHAAVKADLSAWRQSREQHGERLMFVESAILRSSGLIDIVDDIWEVTAPLDVRIERVGRRSGLTEAQIRGRIAAQASENLDDVSHSEIVNAPSRAILPQIHRLLEKYTR